MKVAIVARPELKGAVELARKLLKILAKEDVVLERRLAAKLGKRGVALSGMRADAIVTIGGDGTVLFAQQQAPDVPVLGINLGGPGFLADVRPRDALKAVRRMAAGELPIRERERLATQIAGKRLRDALNEAAVSSAQVGKSLMFRVLVDGKLAMRTQGDGMIISTPTGSTAYALAAGGPIIDPSLDALVIVPVCAVRQRASPLVVPMESVIKVELVRPDRRALVVIDGQRAAEVDPADELVFRRSERPAKFFTWGSDFYQKVREKLW